MNRVTIELNTDLSADSTIKAIRAEHPNETCVIVKDYIGTVAYGIGGIRPVGQLNCIKEETTVKTQQFYNLGTLPEWDDPVEIVIVNPLPPIQPKTETAYYLPRKIENQFEVVLDCLDAVEHGEHIGAQAIADEVRILRGLVDDALMWAALTEPEKWEEDPERAAREAAERARARYGNLGGIEAYALEANRRYYQELADHYREAGQEAQTDYYQGMADERQGSKEVG